MFSDPTSNKNFGHLTEKYLALIASLYQSERKFRQIGHQGAEVDRDAERRADLVSEHGDQ
jgi:hypothetical protein